MSHLPRLLRRRKLLAGPAALLAGAAVMFAVLFTTEPAAHGSGTVVSNDPSVIAAGQILYQAHCQACHGYEGQGGVVSGAPALVSVGAAAADFYLTTGRMPLNAPNNEALRHHPGFDDQQISEIVSYIANLPQVTGAAPGPPIPNVLPLCPNETTPTSSTSSTSSTSIASASGSSSSYSYSPSGSSSSGSSSETCVTLSEGEQLYSINCAQCHHASGAGGMLSGGNVVPGLHNASLEQAAEAPLVGPMPMPRFSKLTGPQLSAIAQYVQYLHHPSDPGGLGIGHFGPVPEGFVAIGIGFVLLWFAARMIGNRG